MVTRKKLRELIGHLKDKASLLKATLSLKRTTSSLHVAVLHATTHASSSPPPDHRIATVLSLGHSSRPTACTCIEAIMDRLHDNRSVFVALKCLIILHNIIMKGSFILKDQLSFYPTSGGRNFLNLSTFCDKADVETWQFSLWVRWYATVLERNLITSRVLGSYFSLSSSITSYIDNSKNNLSSLLNTELLREVDALVGMVEEIRKAPESLNYQKNDIVYEVMRLVGEDYRSTQYQIMVRLSEFGERVSCLSTIESAELTCFLKRLEVCKERLMVIFGNKKRNDEFWDLISQTKMKIEKVSEDRKRGRFMLTMGTIEERSESTRIGGRVEWPSQFLLPYESRWLEVDRVRPAVPMTMA